MERGSLSIVGIGPGSFAQTTQRAAEVLHGVDLIVGYEGYIEQVRAWLPSQRYLASPITHELERAQLAVDHALRSERVALIGSGDAGVYGLAGLVLELLAERDAAALPLEIVPGVTAALSAAALLGAPLGHDFAAVSLSDLLTPWETIVRRLEAVAAADFVTVLYNPASRRRRRQLEDARSIFLKHRSRETPVGLVADAYRPAQRIGISTLAAFDANAVDMLTTIIIGNRTTFRWRDRLITPRGYLTPQPPSLERKGELTHDKEGGAN
ncbi:MAG: precorrin-3B C(17)-methyltransferase [Dehalococcoidia bacterium]